MVVELTIGDGKPAQKTLSYRAVKDKAIAAGFTYLDNVAFTPNFFRKFLERSGAFDRAEHILYLRNVEKNPNISDETYSYVSDAIFHEEFNRFEKKCIHDGVKSLPRDKRESLIVRSDEPWGGAGTGLGKSSNASAYSIDLTENAIKSVLASQFSLNVNAFKALKGVTGDFGAMLMPRVRSAISVEWDLQENDIIIMNYLGQFNGKSIMQLTEKYYSNIRTVLGNRLFHPGFDERILRLVEIGGPCYLEAMESRNARNQPSYSIVQHYPYSISKITKPNVELDSIVCQTDKVIGTGLLLTDGIYPLNPNQKSEEDLEFNMNNKGYLLFVKTHYFEDFRSIPLDFYSNAGAVLLLVSNTENHPLSHVNGFVRELNIPFLITSASFNDNYHRMERFLLSNPNARLLVYANEFADEGFISTDVPQKQKKP